MDMILLETSELNCNWAFLWAENISASRPHELMSKGSHCLAVSLYSVDLEKLVSLKRKSITSNSETLTSTVANSVHNVKGLYSQKMS